jgi:hypothetical protein
MEFKLVYGNHHHGAIQIYDTLMLIKHGLESIGHKVDLEKNMTPGKTNILVEFFTYDFVEVAREFSNVPGTEFIVVATEFITGDTFNNFEGNKLEGTEDMQGQYAALRPWKKRFRTFGLVYELSRAVWHLSEHQVENYRQSLQADNIFYLPHGYLPAMERVVDKPWQHKDIDILFTGTRTPYRDAILATLEQAGLNIKQLPVLTPEFIREDWVARSKLALNIRQNSQWQYPSNSRFYYHLVNASPLLSEACPLSCDLTPYIEHVSAEDMLDKCKEMLGLREGLKEHALMARDRFRDTMPMAPMIERLLDETYASSI